MGYGVGGLLAEAAREGIVEAAEGEFHARVGEFARLRERAIVGIIFVERLGERGLQDHRDIFRAQEIFHFVGFGAAGEDHFEFLLVAEFDGVANFARAVGEDEHGQFAANDRDERFEFQIALIIGGAAVTPWLARSGARCRASR